jgi:hypothetical protein
MFLVLMQGLSTAKTPVSALDATRRVVTRSPADPTRPPSIACAFAQRHEFLPHCGACLIEKCGLSISTCKIDDDSEYSGNIRPKYRKISTHKQHYHMLACSRPTMVPLVAH